MGYVFISYSTKNQSIADAMKKLLNDSNIDTWMAPGDIPVGRKYAEVINRAVKDCACFMLMLSNDSQSSIWVAKETERAISYRKTIIPVQIEDVVLNDEFELYISTDQLIAIRKIDPNNEDIKKLLKSVITYTGRRKTGFMLVSKDSNELKIQLQDGVNIVGRNPRKATILIDDVSISSLHASLTLSEGRCVISDINSMNGTYVNGNRIQPNKEIELKDGDQISFGSMGFLIQSVEG